MRRLKFLISMEGSINRLQFWLFFIGSSVVAFLMMVLGVMIHPRNSQHGKMAFALLFTGALVVSIWTIFVIFTKRWHDMNRSGLWTLLWFIPFAGPFMVIGWLGFVPGQNSHRRRRHHSRSEDSIEASTAEYRPISKVTSEGS